MLVLEGIFFLFFILNVEQNKLPEINGIRHDGLVAFKVDEYTQSWLSLAAPSYSGADTAQLTSLPAADTILYKVMYTKTPSGLLPVLVPAGTQ